MAYGKKTIEKARKAIEFVEDWQRRKQDAVQNGDRLTISMMDDDDLTTYILGCDILNTAKGQYSVIHSGEGPTELRDVVCSNTKVRQILGKDRSKALNRLSNNRTHRAVTLLGFDDETRTGITDMVSRYCRDDENCPFSSEKELIDDVMKIPEDKLVNYARRVLVSTALYHLDTRDSEGPDPKEV